MKTITLIPWILILIVFSCDSGKPVPFAYGNFEAEEIILSSESSGRIIEFIPEEGQLLNSGDYCGYTDTLQLYLKKIQLFTGLNTLKAKFIQLDKQLLVNESGMKNLEREKSRISSLLSEGAATGRQYDDINGQVEVMNAQTEALSSQRAILLSEKESLAVQIRQVDDLIAKSIIRSPVSGTVLEKYVYTGELTVSGKPLLKIGDLSELVLRVFISGSQLEQLKIGAGVDVFVDASDGTYKAHRGTVSWISSKSEFTPKIIQTRDERVNLVYAVKIRVKNDGSLKIGMPGEIRL